MKTFWQELKNKSKPFFALAPMEDVTDTVFRRLIATLGGPDVYFTEFTSVEGMLSKGAEHVQRRLEYTEEERPLIAQIWGLKPENFYKATQILVERKFDGIDLNMGCPDKSVTSKGACSALIKNPALAKEIIQATKEAAGDLPVSVKTRIGYSHIQTEEWCGFLLEQGIEALTVHGRTVREMSKVPAHWDEITKVVQLRDTMQLTTVIMGNGDVKSMVDGKEKAAMTGADGIMVGRGIFENAWFFNASVIPTEITLEIRIAVLLQHVGLYEQKTGERLPFHTLKKYFKIYIRDLEGASELRAKLMETTTTSEVRSLLAGISLH